MSNGASTALVEAEPVPVPVSTPSARGRVKKAAPSATEHRRPALNTASVCSSNPVGIASLNSQSRDAPLAA